MFLDAGSGFVPRDLMLSDWYFMTGRVRRVEWVLGQSEALWRVTSCERGAANLRASLSDSRIIRRARTQVLKNSEIGC